MTLINFAAKKLDTQIKTDALSVDGYEAENLIDDSFLGGFLPKKHFMAEYYVKCPVAVVLRFPCLVDISAVVIGPRVSSNHCSKCIEVYTAFERPIMNNARDHSSIAVSWEYQNDLINQPSHSLFNFVGKFNERHYNAIDRIVFQNYQHQTFYQAQFNENLTNLPLKPLISTRSCSHLLIKVTYATIPVLKFLEVWGTVSSRNPSKLVASITSRMDMMSHEKKYKEEQEKTALVSTENEEPLKNLSNVTVEASIPDEFVDPLTCDVMTFPLLLPSGKNIDKTTYDKFIAMEEKYGRIPCDPFTGVVFHGNKRPVPNMILKSRIDHFLMKNKQLDTTPCNVLGSKKKSIDVVQNKRLQPPKKRDSEVLSLHTPTVEITTISSIERCKRMKLPDESHQSELSKSLDDALSKTIQLLPLSNMPKPEFKVGPGLKKCENCSIDDLNVLYKLPCSHLFCKTCLVGLLNGKTECSSCHKIFTKLDVFKYR